MSASRDKPEDLGQHEHVYESLRTYPPNIPTDGAAVEVGEHLFDVTSVRCRSTHHISSM